MIQAACAESIAAREGWPLHCSAGRSPMSKVISGISMSLDGFVTGPHVNREQQLGDGGDVLHKWLWEPDEHDAELLDSMAANVGSILMGRRSYDLAEGDGG